LGPLSLFKRGRETFRLLHTAAEVGKGL